MPSDDADYQRALAGGKPPVPADLLQAAGEALHGRDWVAPLARQLDVDPDTVSRWKNGKTRVTPRIVPELLKAVRDRVAALQAAEKRLKVFL